jgi:hypothetical protein
MATSHSTVVCRSCGSNRVYLSHRRGVEHLLRLFVQTYRCHTCDARFWKLRLKTDRLLIWTVRIVVVVMILVLLWTLLHKAAQPPPLEG